VNSLRHTNPDYTISNHNGPVGGMGVWVQDEVVQLA